MTDRPLRKGDIVTDEHGHILRVLDPTFDHTDEGHVAMVESEVDKERFRIPVTDLVLPDEVGPPEETHTLRVAYNPTFREHVGYCTCGQTTSYLKIEAAVRQEHREHLKEVGHDG